MQANTAEEQSQSETLPGWQLGKNLGTCLRELYDQKLWTDVKFRCKDHDDDERIHAHKYSCCVTLLKTILTAGSPVFQAMFFGALTENKEEVQLEDAEKRIFDLFLRYVYTDTVTLEDGTATKLLQIAHLYQVAGLVQLCAEYLATIIRTENACGILTTALVYNISSLKNACCSFIDQNVQAILNSEALMDLKEDGLLHILKGDTFKADEVDIVLKAEEWSIKKLKESGLEQNGDNIRKTLRGAFYQLRLPTISYQALVKCTQNKGYLSVDEYMNIVDFINGIPDTSVTSNSCIARIPVNESLIMKEAESEESMRHHSLSASFDIHVLKDVELLSFGVCGIELCLLYDHCKNTHNTETEIATWNTTLEDVFVEYANKVIKLKKKTGTVTVIVKEQFVSIKNCQD
ncbi:BTB/POZ domain-containing protein 3-like [Mercenaria mercenaria]|uniref:BTB/POZ domain-containing protein 3-like n=1 Tax=Mercenaria mercenaria TaxID=6596 RepID=UPI00234F153D|nr:BTB/POZ domain-containing protein 3-like [Mercenaria mercenaria]